MIELTAGEVYGILRKAITDAGSQKAFAQQAGVSAAYVNDIIRGRRGYSDRILEELGVQRIVRFVRFVVRGHD
ncbi:transcriptional regulator [uncultured Methylobacterium sp.]|jgi:plasmid maintenance system antidote protein VapI|uniref:transcriptional regulator n=1 Tax=uncultured Methylobacterium sp. TaxID=157278 RepID=UPI0026213F44|nr:transcriptional regulator [uncultured Methylobacterium sp.]